MAPIKDLLEGATLDQLVHLVKALHKQLQPPASGSWTEFLRARGKKDGVDPSRHKREVLEAYVLGLLVAAADGGDGATEHAAAAEFVRRYLKWARVVRKDEAKGRGVVPSEEQEAASCSGSQQQVSVWSLVRRTRAHPKYGKYYGELQSYAPGWCRVKRLPLSLSVRPRLLAVDCEMCATADDPSALLGVCVVDEFGRVLYRQLVRPPGEIKDLRTALTGVTEEDMAKVTLTFEEAQRAVRKLLEGGAGAGAGDDGEGSGGEGGDGASSRRPVVLVGHSLHHDLAALKLDHQPVIDTSLVFGFRGLPDCTPGLKDLARSLLGLEMREERGGAHDSREDAGVSMRLVMRELQMARPTPPLDPPQVKVSAADRAKLFVHSLPEGATEAALRQAFADAGAPAVVRLEGDMAERKVHLVFAHLGAAGEAFNKLPGEARKDSMGRPYKEVPLGASGLTCKVRKMTAGGDLMFARQAPHAGAKRARSTAGASREGGEKAPAAGSESVRKPKRQKRDAAGRGGGGRGGSGANGGKEMDPLKEAGKQGRTPKQHALANGEGGAAAAVPAAAAGPAPAHGGGADAGAAATPSGAKKHKKRTTDEQAAREEGAAAGVGAAPTPVASTPTPAADGAAAPADAATGEAPKSKKKDKADRKRKRDRKEEEAREGDEAGEERGKKSKKGA